MSKNLLDFIKEAKSKINEVDVLQASKMLGQGYKILDVREPGEFMTGMIKGAINVPRGILEAAADLNYPGANPVLRDFRDDKWLILCRTGGRSAMATDTLQQMGFTDVTNIAGGMLAWNEAKLESISQTV